VALLKNTRGEIDINLPISARWTTRSFGRGIIVQVIVNCWRKWSPRRSRCWPPRLGAVKSSATWSSRRRRNAGTAQLQRLDTLAKALNDRPGLKLDVIGRVEPTADADGVRRAKFESKLRAAKVRQLTRGGGESVIRAKSRSTTRSDRR